MLLAAVKAAAGAVPVYVEMYGFARAGLGHIARDYCRMSTT